MAKAAAFALGLAGVAAVAAVHGCVHRPPPAAGPWQAVAPADWPDLADDGDLEPLAEACRSAVGFLGRLPDDRPVELAGQSWQKAELADGVRRACEIIATAGSPERRRALLQEDFVLLRSAGRDGRGEVLVTGYYEPLLEASRAPTGAFVHPVYEVPDDLVTVELADFGIAADPGRLVGRVEGGRLAPYPDRAAIDFGAGLVSRPRVIGYVADPVDLFFLHVQGSGTLIFADGERIRAGYAATNGRPYRSIGRLLIDDGLVDPEEMSMQAIREYLSAHPDDLSRVLGYNPSYVFFRQLPASGGPLGCFGEPLAAGRAIAVDLRVLPVPVVGWLRAALPEAVAGEAETRRFVLNLDTGSSITGPGRVDLFFGAGPGAGELAGRTRHPGELFVLVPRRDPG
ncbi:MAG: MltA domain-containing protein [Thermoanaerobaculales bacterium]|jgi:membrane-bound lytic murein transglycosylase A|nr:MltA domain-containing protein [Thermoanaerobaculales bacterium]